MASKEKLNIIVSSGGTVVPIDDVRVISNLSSGTTGAQISREALRRGHNVHLIRSRGSKTPFDEELRANPLAEDITEETHKIEAALREILPFKSTYKDQAIRDFDSYRQKLLEAVSDPDVDVAIISMAASDYGPEKQDGKISSNQNHLMLELKPLPKIISEIKPTRRDIFLVGFKFLDSDASPDELIEAAYKSLLRDKQDLAVANLGKMGTTELLTYLVTIEKGVIPVIERANLPRILMETIEQRYSTDHYKTKFKRVDELPVSEREVGQFLNDIHRISNLSLFAEYLSGGREEFGFVAKRTEKGTLITGRGSSKSSSEVKDLALVTNLDEEARTMSVQSVGGKAALNANVAHLILENRSDINYIIHSHIPLPEAESAQAQSAPGTQEDWDRIRDVVLSGSEIVYQPAHGVLILLKDLDELIPLLLRQNIYKKSPESYDLAYSRFQKNPRFTEVIRERLDPKGIYLDLAAGTGEVTRDLLDYGFKNIYLGDASENMLSVAQAKLPELSSDRFSIKTFEGLSDTDAYNGIFIRQAINYIKPENLVEVFAGFKRALKSEGKLIFNSFTTEGLESSLKTVKKDETGNYILLTREGNIVEDNVIFHGQRTEAFDRVSGDYNIVYDLNKFYAYSPEEFEAALKNAGFNEVEIIEEGRSVYICAS